MKTTVRRSLRSLVSLVLVLALILSLSATAITGVAKASKDSKFQVGVGKASITGPITDISTGYNSLGDLMEGILMNLNARAFVMKQGSTYMCYVSAELVHLTESIKPGVIQELQSRGLTQYTEANTMIGCTHCHSSTSNVSWYGLYDLVNGVPGYDEESYGVIVQGIADAIEKANKDLAPGSVTAYYDDADVEAFNRSIIAYGWNKNVDLDLNDNAELVKAAAECTNKEMSVIEFKHDGEGGIGCISFFASHGTSNGINNTLVAADHKGYASYFIEKYKGNGYVCAFPQNESGDASPNQPQTKDVTAAFLRPNDINKNLKAIENEIVDGQQEADETLRILKGGKGVTKINLSKSIAYDYTTVDFSNVKVQKKYIGKWHMDYDDVDNAKTSVPCIGAAIIAGDEEGAPVDNAKEGTVRNNYYIDKDGKVVREEPVFADTIDLSGLEKLFDPLWPYAMKLLESDEYDDEQMEKVVCLACSGRDVLLDLKETTEPFQMFKIGELVIASVPFEYTTECARRINVQLSKTLKAAGVKHVVFSALTNSYSQYITTREEYAAQHYEGSTNLYGPWSDAAAKQILDGLAQNIVAGKHSDPGPGMTQSPSNLTSTVVKTYASATTPLPDSEDVGALVTDVKKSKYKNGQTVTATFKAANPRHITVLKLAGNTKLAPDDYSYMYVQKKINGKWKNVRTIADPYTYIRIPGFTDNVDQEVKVCWLIKKMGGGKVTNGTYRLVYNAVSLTATGYTNVKGYSSAFKIVG